MINEPGSWTIYNVPASHRHSQLSNFVWDRAKHAVAPIQKFLENTQKQLAPHLLLLGPPGTGKTHLLYSIYRWAVLQSDLLRVRALHVPSFCDAVKKTFDAGGDLFEEVTPAKYFLAYDDIFGRELSKYDLQTTIPRLLEIANHNRAALVATTNYTVEEMGALLAPHELDRLLERATVIQFGGKSNRITNAPD